VSQVEMVDQKVLEVELLLPLEIQLKMLRNLSKRILLQNFHNYRMGT
jgi:hypothetical protein